MKRIILRLALFTFIPLAAPASAGVLYSFAGASGDSFAVTLPATVTTQALIAPADLDSYTWTYFLPFLGGGLFPAGSGYFGGAQDTQDIVGVRFDCGGGGFYCEGYAFFAAGAFATPGTHQSIGYQGLPPGGPSFLTVTATPEPSSFGVLLAGIAAMAVLQWRRLSPLARKIKV
jgi:hypothetical protein